MLGAILHRSEKAFAWLLDVVVDGDRASAKFVVEELVIYSTDKHLGERIEAAVVQREDDRLMANFRETWHKHNA